MRVIAIPPQFVLDLFPKLEKRGWVGVLMRRAVLLIVDIALMVLATLAAFVLRENFEVHESRLLEFLPYLTATAAASSVVFPAAGLNRTVWRFSGLSDYLRVTSAVAGVVLAAAAMAFAYNRLEGIARSLPILQLLAGTAFMTGARVLHRLIHAAREQRKAATALLEFSDGPPELTVVIVGISRLTETYLLAAAELAPGRVRIAGLVGRAQRHAGRLVANHPVLGVPEDIEQILNGLDVHGIHADRIVVATLFESLSPEAREALLRVERCRNIVLHLLAENLGFEERALPASNGGHPLPQNEDLSFEISAGELSLLAARPYWHVKRVVDRLAAFALLVACTPLMLLAALAVAANMGFPVIFWQQRPGLGGKPFRLYKFRTMRAAHSAGGRRLTDGERTPYMGTLLRRLRFDELPQLFNILKGDMSFVGPRPLLPRDQSAAYRARLLVRPGLTGWAQAVGGREISPGDKAALDVWYVRNASIALDIEIALRTVPIILFGERMSTVLIERAWSDLRESGVLKSS